MNPQNSENSDSGKLRVDQTSTVAPPVLPFQATSGQVTDSSAPKASNDSSIGILGKMGGEMQTPAEAADNDVIENEWVMKAKNIVATTKGDPHKQVGQLNKLKADYMKKRYDKDVKLADV